MSGPSRGAIAIVLALALACLPSEVCAAKGPDAGRRHAAKANRLSARNKCKPAIPEFTKAYQLLHDPTLLFNRAECFRRLGKHAEAIQDYEGFLAGAPNAPNRTVVEERIATLRTSIAGAGSEGGAPARASEPSEVKSPVSPTAHAAKWGDEDFAAPSTAVDAGRQPERASR